MDFDLALNFIYALGPLVMSAVQFYETMRKRIRWTRTTENLLGALGYPYRQIEVVPQKIFRGLLLAIIVIALTALIEGALEATDNTSLPRLRELGLFEQSIWIFVAWILLAVVVHFNLVSKLQLHRYKQKSENTYLPGWINAAWHIEDGENAKPVNLDATACERVANNLVMALRNGQDFSGDRALRPAGLPADELANAWLFGCIIEGKLYDLQQGPPSWKAFYDALGQIALRPERPFAPQYLKTFKQNHPNEAFYNHLRSLAPPAQLPDNVTVSNTVENTLNRLCEAYDGSARNIACRDANAAPSIVRADQHAATFPRLDGPTNAPMRAQFLKLAVGMDVWPGIEPGPFVFPFSKGVARMLFNLGCLRTTPAIKSLVIDDKQKHLVAYTESEIVHQVKTLFEGAPDAAITAYCQNTFGCLPGEVPLWHLSYEIDYILWHLARTKNLSVAAQVFETDVTEPWSLDGNALNRE